MSKTLRTFSRIGRGSAAAVRRNPRSILWIAVAAGVVGFLVALEIAARHYGDAGPVTNQAREVVLAPDSGPLLYAGLALMMVVLTWRQRFWTAGLAVGIDVVFWLVRLAVGADMNFGNGAMWVIIGWVVVALTRRTGNERMLLLKGAGLGMLLIAGHKTGDTWLLITSKTRPDVLDPYVATADHALGDPSWLVGQAVDASGPVGTHLLNGVYGQLPLAAALIALYQLRNVAAERRFPAHHMVRTFLTIGLLGPAVYMIFPVVGPVFAYGADGGQWAVANVWPDVVPAIGTPHPIPFDEITPRNCMPSLHTAWATTLFIHSRHGSRFFRIAGGFWLVATLTATLGFGYHYGADLLAGAVFALTVEAAMRSFARGWDLSSYRLIGYGSVVFVALLVSYRFIPVQMADHPWVFGPLLLLLTASVVYLYMRTTKAWEQPDEPAAPVERQESQQLLPA
ncbi:phosphatase PAP2 family protein [Yinghuangia aomiensis]|uniref:phosphatase PAP2 family protein n=1 Tax=Yinghuangia aomiensis TaxID=676205 RepID=UPI0031E8A257